MGKESTEHFSSPENGAKNQPADTKGKLSDLKTTIEAEKRILDERVLGEYTGFAPTDESNVGYGEIHITVTEKSLTFRFATGLEVRTEEISAETLSSISESEIAKEYQQESEFTKRTIGYKLQNGMRILFMPDAHGDGEMGLILRGNKMSDMMGVTFLFNSRQIGQGAFSHALEKFGTDKIPRLENNGKAAEKLRKK